MTMFDFANTVPIEMVEQVECVGCNKKHDKKGKNYFLVAGNVYVGWLGGLIGNNLGPDGKVFNSSCYCKGCLIDYLSDYDKHDSK